MEVPGGAGTPQEGGPCAQRGPTDRGHPLPAVSLDTLGSCRGKSQRVLSMGSHVGAGLSLPAPAEPQPWLFPGDPRAKEGALGCGQPLFLGTLRGWTSLQSLSPTWTKISFGNPLCPQTLVQAQQELILLVKGVNWHKFVPWTF